MRSDPAFEAAKSLPKGPPKSTKAAARNRAFNDVAVAHGFTSDALGTYGSGLRLTWVRHHVGAQEAQRLATRAFDAVNRWNLGKGGKPRFKNVRRGLRSLECKDHCGDMAPVLDNGHLVAVRWSDTVIPVAPIPEHPSSRADREAAGERARLEALIAAGGLQYELMYILKPDLSEEVQQAAFDKVQQIVQNAGGIVEKTDKWGRRKLSYEIKDYPEGFYVLVNFSGDGTISNEIIRLLNINEEVIRSIVIRLDD